MRLGSAQPEYERTSRGRFGKALAGFALLFLIGMAAKSEGGISSTPMSEAFVSETAKSLADAVCMEYLPGTAVYSDMKYGDWLVSTQIETILPLYAMARRDNRDKVQTLAVWEDDGHSRVMTYEEINNRENEESEGLSYAGALTNEDLQMLLQEENQAAHAIASQFVPHEQKIKLNPEDWSDYETLIKTFYTIDANTMVGSDQLNIKDLYGADMTLDKNAEGPQILIYHTHSQETFSDSIPGDSETSIVGVGEFLAQILRGRYGYTVLHHTGSYDADTRDDAYGKALPALEQILDENPSIQVVIDLHRDEMAEENRLVMNLDGRPTARFMFFNGLSRTKKSGNIDYLENENIAGNLAFSFQMQLKCEEYYPGITRKIYLKGYRYNLHLRPRSLLVELGAQNNTVEEAMNACEPLAHVLDMVLQGD